MIQELLEFYDLQNYDHNFCRRPPKKRETKAKSKNKGGSTMNRQGSNATISSLSKELSVAEKIRQQEIEEEKHQKELEKFLPKKPKKINVDKFLERELNYEQRRQYNLEMMRNKQREENKKENVGMPSLTDSTRKIIDKHKYDPYQPIYVKKTDSSQYKELKYQLEKEKEKKKSKSIEKFEHHKTEHTVPKENFKEWFDSLYNRMTTYDADLIERKNRARSQDKEDKKKQEKQYFNPKIDNNSEKIMKRKKQQSVDRLRTHPGNNKFNPIMTDTMTQPGEGKIKRNCSVDFNSLRLASTRKNNKKRNRSMEHLYYDRKNVPEIPQDVKDRVKEEKKMRKKLRNKSVDRRKKSNDFIDVMQVGKVKKTEKIEHWSTQLNRIEKKQNKGRKKGDSDDEIPVNVVPNEILYKLNIMHAAAWNDNDVNKVQCWGETRDIVKKFLE